MEGRWFRLGDSRRYLTKSVAHLETDGEYLMAFRHPPPWLYWLAFGIPIAIGLFGALDVWRSVNDTSIVARIGVTTLAAVAPLIGMLVVTALFTLVMLYFGTPRKGNRMIVTGGEHEGKTAVVTQRHGLADHGWVHVRLPGDGINTTISPYHLKKTGLWSHLL